MKNYCGLDCAQCPAVDSCPGCAATGGKPFGGTCVLGECCKAQGCETTRQLLFRDMRRKGAAHPGV